MNWQKFEEQRKPGFLLVNIKSCIKAWDEQQHQNNAATTHTEYNLNI